AAAMPAHLFARFGIALAILPNPASGPPTSAVATRGSWSLVRLRAAPVAALVSEWMWIADERTALARLFPPGTGHGLDPGVIVLAGRGTDHQDEPAPPEPCTIERWRPGAIDLACDAAGAAYAVISSSAARGWSVTVDRYDTEWQTADVIRRAVA